jgi:hypothetical protein
METYAKTRQELVRISGVTAKTLASMEKRSDAPPIDPERGYNLLAWLPYIARSKGQGPARDEDLRAIRIRKEKAAADLAEIKLARERGSLIDKGAVTDTTRSMLSQLFEALERTFVDVLPNDYEQHAGNAQECAELNRAAIRRLRIQFSRGNE